MTCREIFHLQSAPRVHQGLLEYAESYISTFPSPDPYGLAGRGGVRCVPYCLCAVSLMW